MRSCAAPLAVGLLVVLGCSDSVRVSDATAPQLKLVEPTGRVAPETVNAHVYGSFAIPVGGGGASAILEEQ